jgi:hypothetical protein
MYGFKKISREKHSIHFRHNYFLKDREENFKMIKRKSKEEVYE